MATELAKAYVQIVPSAQGMQSGIETALSGEANTAGDTAGKNFANKFLGVSAGLIAAGTAAVTAAAGAVWSAATDTAEAGDNIDKMSQKIGISTDAYQEWAFVMEHCGTNVDNLQGGMKTLSSVITDAANGSDSAAEKLDAVGLSVEDLNGLSQEEQLSLIISSLQGMGEGAERTSAATDLLGRSATDMAALLNMSAEETEAMKQEIHDLGGVMSEDAVKDSATFEDSLTNLKTAFGGLKKGMVSDFLPGMTTVMDGFTKLVAGDSGGIAQIKQGIEQFLGQLKKMIPDMLSIAGDLISAFVDVIIDNLPEIIEMGVELIVKLIAGIVQALPQLIAKTPEIIKAIVQGLASALPELATAGQNLVNGIWNGISAGTQWIKDKITGWVGDITSFIKELFGIASPSRLMRDEIGKFIPQGIAVGIDANTSAVEKSMNALADITTSSFNADYSVSGYTPEQSDQAENIYNAVIAGMRDAGLKIEVGGREFGRIVKAYA